MHAVIKKCNACKLKHTLLFCDKKQIKTNSAERTSLTLSVVYSEEQRVQLIELEVRRRIRTRARESGLIPRGLRSVFKHHRLTRQQIHQNIWAKPQALCNPSSGSAPKLNLLSNHPSANRVSLCANAPLFSHTQVCQNLV